MPAVVVRRLDDRRHQPGRADAVAAHVHRDVLAVGTGHRRLHRLGILGAEIEDVPYLDAARRELVLGVDRRPEGRLVRHLVGGCEERGPVLEDRRQVLAEVGVDRRDRLVGQALVEEHGALARLGKHVELVAHVAADRAGVGPHRHAHEPHAVEGAQVRDEHPVEGLCGAGLVEVERIGVLHQELARAHGAEARPHLVAELPLDVIQIQRQVLVGAHVAPEDVGDHLLVGRPEQHVALVPVLDAEHLLAIGVVAAGFTPEIGRLHRRHQQLDGAGAVLLFLDDADDLVEHLVAERQPRVAARGLLLDHARPQHQLVRDDLGFLRRLLQEGQEVSAETHEFSSGARGFGWQTL